MADLMSRRRAVVMAHQIGLMVSQKDFQHFSLYIPFKVKQTAGKKKVCSTVAREKHLIPDSDKEAMNSVVGIADDHLSKHYCPFCVNGTVCDPVLLGQGGGGPDHKLVCLVVEGGSGLHLNCVVACGWPTS